MAERNILRGGVDVASHAEFSRQRAAADAANRNFSETYLTCTVCGFQCAASVFAGTGQKSCPNCHSEKAPRQTCLPYVTRDPQGLPIPENAPPTEAEIRQLDRLGEPGAVR